MRSNNCFHKFFVFFMSGLMLLQGPMFSVVQAQMPDPIAPDGRTQTSVNVNGSITDIRTDTINGVNAYNSFNRFNVPGGTTANLHVPDAAQNLVNLVHNERSQIDGILNSYKNGQIGGNVYFLNPHGIMIGQSGVVNVGSLTMMTPSQEFMNDLISKGGVISSRHEQQLFEGNVPLSETGVISVKGKVRAVDTIAITANGVNVDSGASLRAGRQVQLDFGDIVNTNGLNTGNEIVISPEGKIRIVAANDVDINGQIAADGIENHKAGDIEIKAGNDINVNVGAEISAKGTENNSDGGNVVVFADHNAMLADGAVIDVSAQHGKGGFLEFSAIDTVNMVGDGLRSSYGGTILIDPETINWTGNGHDVYTNGADYKLNTEGKYGSITLNDILISTRRVDDSGLTGEEKRNTHRTGDSLGHSGSITLNAEYIKLDNVNFLTFATGSFDAGSIGIFKSDDGCNPVGWKDDGYEDSRDPVDWKNNVFDAHSVDGRAGNIVISAISNHLKLIDSTFDNAAQNMGNVATHSGSLRLGSLASLDDPNLKEGGTFEIINSTIKTGDFFIKGATNFADGKVAITNSRDILANRIYLESGKDISIINSVLKTRKVHLINSVNDAADITLNLIQNEDANTADVVAKRTGTIKIDANSILEGNDIFIQSVVTAGKHLEVVEIKD